MEEDFQIIQDSFSKNERPKKRLLTNFLVDSKCKIMGSLYNLVHSYPTTYPQFSDSPIFILGKSFFYVPSNDPHFNALDSPNSGSKMPHQVANGESPDNRVFFFPGMLQTFYSFVWFSYRKDIPPLEPSLLTTDIGWGCMLRTGQMLVARALLHHLCGMNWELNAKDQMSPFSYYRQILRWFADSPSPKCPYSIHNFVKRSTLIDQRQYGNSPVPTNTNKVGEFFTPSRICQIIKEIVRIHSPNGLTCYIAKDGILYRDSIISLCTSNSKQPLGRLSLVDRPERLSVGWIHLEESQEFEHMSSFSNYGEDAKQENDSEQLDPEQSEWRSVIILVPLRLGAQSVNKTYLNTLKSMFRFPQSLGVLGGRPRQSLYFVGYQDDDVLFLDPHIARPYMRPEDKFSVDQFHCSIPQKMPFLDIDPSLVVGFYCKERKDFDQLCDFIQQMEKMGNPTLSVQESCPPDHEDNGYGSCDEDETEDVVMV